MKIRYFGILIILIVLSSCFGTKDIPRERSRLSGQKDSKVKIGLVWPIDLYKDLVEEGVRLAVEQINESGGIGGRSVELVVRDDNADINEGLKIAEYFAEDPEVMAVIGHCDSYVSLAVALVYEINNLIMFSPGSTHPGLTQKGYSYIFRNVPTDDMIGSKAAEWCKDKGYKDVIICYASTSYGLGLANVFERKARELELKIVDRSPYNLGDAAEFDYILDRWEIYNYDAVLFAGIIDAGTTFLTKMRERERATADKLGQEPFLHPIIGGDGIDSVELLKLPEEVTQDVFVVTMHNPYSDRPEAVRFNQAYFKRFNHDPDSWAALGYDALNVIVEAMRKAGSTDPKKVAPEIRKITEWVGVTGLHTFNDQGDVAKKTLALKFLNDGEFKYLDLE